MSPRDHATQGKLLHLRDIYLLFQLLRWKTKRALLLYFVGQVSSDWGHAPRKPSHLTIATRVHTSQMTYFTISTSCTVPFLLARYSNKKSRYIVVH
jgi:hypothetical protein